MRKTQEKTGCINLFFGEEDTDYRDQLLTNHSMGPQVISLVDHKKYEGESCHIKTYGDGWVVIEYAGCCMVVPECFVQRQRINDRLPEVYRPRRVGAMFRRMKKEEIQGISYKKKVGADSVLNEWL